jgi:hypothetical protein
MKLKKKIASKPSQIVAQNAPRNVSPAVPVAATTSTGTRTAVRAIGREAIAYAFHRQWKKSQLAGEYEFLWDLTTEDGPLRAAFGPLDEFPNVARRRLRDLPGLEAGDLVRTRLMGNEEAQLLVVCGFGSREKRPYRVERWHLLRGELGWRIESIDTRSMPAETPLTELKFELFAAVSAPEWFVPFQKERDLERAKQRTEQLAARDELIRMKALLAAAAPAAEVSESSDPA